MYKLREESEELSPSSEPDIIIHTFETLLDRELFIDTWIKERETNEYLERNFSPCGFVGFYSKYGSWVYELYLEN